MTIESVVGTLPEAYRLLRPDSILHVDQLITERRTDLELRQQWFYTADGEVYFLQGKENIPTLAMTRRASNPLLQDSTIDTYCGQLRREGNYRPSAEETQRALEAPDTLLVDLTKLQLSGNETEWRYLAIDPRKWENLNPEQRKFAERVYGPLKEFAANMKMLSDARISEMKIFVLNPIYVREHAQQGALGRASWLDNFYISNFYAYGRNLDNHSRVRGVRLGVAPEGRAALENTVPSDAVAPSEMKVPTMEQVLALGRQYVAPHSLPAFEMDIGKLYKP